MAGHLTDEQRCHAWWIGASKWQVILERALRGHLPQQDFHLFDRARSQAHDARASCPHRGRKNTVGGPEPWSRPKDRRNLQEVIRDTGSGVHLNDLPFSTWRKISRNR